MTKKLTHHESFAPISRGLKRHFHDMNDRMVKAYVYILLSVSPTGERKGLFSIAAIDFADELKWNIKTLYKTLKDLNYFVSVKYPKSRHSILEISVNKYKGVEDFYHSTKGKGTGYSKSSTVPLPYPLPSHDRSTKGKGTGYGKGTVTIDKSVNDNGLELPNNKISRKEEKEDIIPSSKKNKTYISDAFIVTDKIREWAKERKFRSPDDLKDAFVDYHLGKGSLQKDWDATFRTWIRNDNKFNPQQKKEFKFNPLK